jgi:hypothetical protein
MTFWLAGRQASGLCRTVSLTKLGTLLQSAADVHSGGSETGMTDHDLHQQPCPHVEVSAVDLRLPTGSRAAETPAEMAPPGIFRPSVLEVYAINSMAIMESTASCRTVH